MKVKDYGVAIVFVCVVVLIIVLGDLNRGRVVRGTAESEKMKDVQDNGHSSTYGDEKDSVLKGIFFNLFNALGVGKCFCG